MTLRRSPGLVAFLLLAVGTQAVAALDWPQYRGPIHDGSSPETLRTQWTEEPPRVVWRKALEPAWSSIVVAGNRAYTQVNRRVGNASREVCIALDAANGSEIWSANLDQASYPDGGTGSNDGPRSTPAVEGDRVFVLTSYLKLFCLRTDTGAVVWSRDFLAEFPETEVINWQNAASPLVVGDRVFLNANVGGKRLMAVRTSDGTTVWSGQDDGMTHATPAYATLGGVPQVVFLTNRGLLGVAPESGSILWRYTFSPSPTSTAATPVVAGDHVYASCAYALGAWTARITRPATAFTVTQTDFKRSSAYQNHWATPVHHDGFLYSVVERSFRSLACFDLAGRTNRWTTDRVGSGNPGYASLIKVGDHLLVLTEDGELVLVEPNPTAYTERAVFKALNGTCWNHPAFANGRLYARSSTEMVVLDLAPPVVPLPALQLAAQPLPLLGRLRLQVTAVNHSPLTLVEAGRIELQISPAPGPDGFTWKRAAAPLVVRDGFLEAEIPAPADSSVLRVLGRSDP